MKKFKNYGFKTEPYDHQLKAMKESWNEPFYALFMEMGTGKSKVAIDTMGMLYENNLINSALIIAPKGVYDNWLQKEIPTHLPDRIDISMIRWQPKDAKSYQKELNDLVYKPFDGLKIFVMNVRDQNI